MQKYKLNDQEEFELWGLIEKNDREGLRLLDIKYYEKCNWKKEHLYIFVQNLKNPETMDYYSTKQIAMKLSTYIEAKFKLRGLS